MFQADCRTGLWDTQDEKERIEDKLQETASASQTHNLEAAFIPFPTHTRLVAMMALKNSSEQEVARTL